MPIPNKITQPVKKEIDDPNLPPNTNPEPLRRTKPEIEPPPKRQTPPEEVPIA